MQSNRVGPVVLALLVTLLLVACQSGQSKKEEMIRDLGLGGSLRPLVDREVDRDVGGARPEYVVSACQFFTEFSRDGRSASQKYGGKVVQITGVHKSSFDTEILIGLGDCGGYLAAHVPCVFQERNPLYGTSQGHMVTVKGRALQTTGYPQLRSCAVVR